MNPTPASTIAFLNREFDFYRHKAARLSLLGWPEEAIFNRLRAVRARRMARAVMRAASNQT